MLRIRQKITLHPPESPQWNSYHSPGNWMAKMIFYSLALMREVGGPIQFGIVCAKMQNRVLLGESLRRGKRPGLVSGCDGRLAMIFPTSSGFLAANLHRNRSHTAASFRFDFRLAEIARSPHDHSTVNLVLVRHVSIKQRRSTAPNSRRPIPDHAVECRAGGGSRRRAEPSPGTGGTVPHLLVSGLCVRPATGT